MFDPIGSLTDPIEQSIKQFGWKAARSPEIPGYDRIRCLNVEHEACAGPHLYRWGLFSFRMTKQERAAEFWKHISETDERVRSWFNKTDQEAFFKQTEHWGQTRLPRKPEPQARTTDVRKVC